MMGYRKNVLDLVDEQGREERKRKKHTRKGRKKVVMNSRDSTRLSKREEPLERLDDARNDFLDTVPADNNEPHPPHDAQNEPLE
jgi:hypothetical protein